jgi:hypothetical protein
MLYLKNSKFDSITRKRIKSMLISTAQTIQPPQPPSTPVVAQQALSELVNYYRELANYHRSLVDYHQKLLEQHSQEAEVAEKQLASIESLLYPLTTEPVNQKTKSNANGKQVNGTALVIPSEDKSEVATFEPKPEELKGEKAATEVGKSKTETSKSVTQDSPKNNGKTKSSSTEAVKTKQTTKKKNTNKTKKPTKANSSRLPYSEKLAFSETIVNAVAVCLQESYPQVIGAEDILKYYYPEGLEGEAKKRAYGAFSNCLSKGAGKQGWVRSSIGKYRWKDES